MQMMELTEKEEALRKQEETKKHNRAVAADASWMCKMFQEEQLDSKEKQEILKSVMLDHKDRKRAR